MNLVRTMNLILEDVSAELYRRLERRAEENQRSLNAEVLDILEQVLDPKPLIVEELLAGAGRLRDSVLVPHITDPFLREAKDWGRH